MQKYTRSCARLAYLVFNRTIAIQCALAIHKKLPRHACKDIPASALRNSAKRRLGSQPTKIFRCMHAAHLTKLHIFLHHMA